jgi:hypothetical protein
MTNKNKKLPADKQARTCFNINIQSSLKKLLTTINRNYIIKYPQRCQEIRLLLKCIRI